MLARTILRNVVDDDTPPDMLGTVLDTLLETHEGTLDLMTNYTEHLFDALSVYDKDDVERYGRQSALQIDGWIKKFNKRYAISTTKLVNLSHRLTDDPDMIAILCGDCTAHALRVCHGKKIRKQYPEAENMIKKRVQMFHDTAQEWCTLVDEFIETCDKKAPMLCRSPHVNFF